MDEIMEWAHMLQASPALIPWIVLVLVCVVTWREKDLVKGFIRARIEAHRESARFSMTYAELVRNNTAALDNNTAALKMVENDRSSTNKLLDHHEKLMEERMAHLQTVVNRIDERTTDNREDIVRVAERVDK